MLQVGKNIHIDITEVKMLNYNKSKLFCSVK